MSAKYYGYMRVSSIDQYEDRQKIDLLKFGINENNLYTDKLSGKDFNRANYQLLRSKVEANDVIVIKSIDRLGRNYHEILKEWRYLVNEKKVDIVIIDMPLLDTRNKNDLIGTLISDIVLQLLSYVAETERINIRQRQAEGIIAAKKRGVKFGRKPKIICDEFIEIYHKWENNLITPKEAISMSGLTPRQFYWSINKIRRNKSTPL